MQRGRTPTFDKSNGLNARVYGGVNDAGNVFILIFSDSNLCHNMS